MLRYLIGKPIIVNSGYRSTEYNKKIGGAINSYHVKGQAADIRVEGLNSKVLYLVIINLINAKLMKNGGVGLYNDFVHYDTGTKRRWNESKHEIFLI